jgi:hypothetical protein
MYREVFNCQWNLSFDIPDKEMWKSCLKRVLSVLQVIKKRLTGLLMHAFVREVRERNVVFTLPYSSDALQIEFIFHNSYATLELPACIHTFFLTTSTYSNRILILNQGLLKNRLYLSFNKVSKRYQQYKNTFRQGVGNYLFAHSWLTLHTI